MNTANGFAGIAVGNADIGAHAGPDTGLKVAADFGQNLRVTDMRASHADHIGLAMGNNVFCMGWVDNPAHRKHRQVNYLAYCAGKMHKNAVTGRRRRPVTATTQVRNIGMGNDVEVIDQARICYLFADDFHLLKIQRAGLKLVSGQAHPQHMIPTQCAANGLQQFH